MVMSSICMRNSHVILCKCNWTVIKTGKWSDSKHTLSPQKVGETEQYGLNQVTLYTINSSLINLITSFNSDSFIFH